jgi:flagellum-specific peptidoglycan hydrolase FlgJ
MKLDEQQFLVRMATAAKAAGHIFPEMAACEAALESGFGKSGLAALDNNLFGMKQHKHPVYGTHVLPTKEFENGEWITVQALWVKYPDYTTCFTDRMATLTRLAPAKGFEHYAAALAAKDAQTYVREVSAKWSTDPHRADKVLVIYEEFQGLQGMGADTGS